MTLFPYPRNQRFRRTAGVHLALNVGLVQHTILLQYLPDLTSIVAVITFFHRLWNTGKPQAEASYALMYILLLLLPPIDCDSLRSGSKPPCEVD